MGIGEVAKGETMNSRDKEVLDAMKKYERGVTPTVLARWLNLRAPCGWCPVLPPKPGTLCAVVPRRTQARVARVLARLERAGLIEDLKIWRLPLWVPKS